ncbi:MAG TPA: hypothetical protein VFB90_05535 [Dehalococcoidia bacterium]|nr:hypothetical protein [Dehalococcoidia bacterium]
MEFIDHEDNPLIVAFRGESAGAAKPARGERDPMKPPTTQEETGLSPSFLVELILKIVHYAEGSTADNVARVAGLPTSLITDLLDNLKRDRLCEVVGSVGAIEGTYRYRLTDRGAERAQQALERCRYAGAAPVTVEQYERVIQACTANAARIEPGLVVQALEELVVQPRTAELLERALHSGRSTMVFGPSGNGKTHLLASLLHRLPGEMLIPYAIYVYGQVVKMFDPLVHVRVQDAEAPPQADGQASREGRESGRDRRWVRIRRPGLIVGGEVTAESLELAYDPLTRFYQAPKHLKAQGGFMVVDDFGRQKISPAEMLNRWIMALERGRDNLLLRTGEAIDIPFNVTLLFSTNLNPDDLADAAFLRRIPYKLYMPGPTPADFREILRKACDAHAVPFSESDLANAVALLDAASNHRLSGALADDIVSIMADNAEFEGRTPALTSAAVEAAYQQFFGLRDSGPVPDRDDTIDDWVADELTG